MIKDRIRETLAFEDLTEEEKTKKHILGRLYGPIADIINPTRNGRRYSEQLWENVFESPLMKEKFKNKVLYGELGHPADRTEIDMEKVAICMPEPPKKDKDGHLIGYFDILDTPNGRILKTLCDYGSTLGISSRGTGDLEEDEYGEESVNPDTYDCECFDVVLVPAVESARLTFTEGLDKNKVNLRKALTESLEKASDEDKKVMKETLENLHIKLDEAEEEEIPEDSVEELPVDKEPKEKKGEEEVELTFDEKIRQLFALTHGGEEAPEEEEIEMFVQAFKSIFPEECFNPEGCADKEEETIEDSEEAIDDGSELVIKSLQDALKNKSELEARAKSLQEQVAVSDAKVTSLEGELTRTKSTITRLTKLARDSKDLSSKLSTLQESLNEKDSKIKELQDNLSKANLDTSMKEEKVNSLVEELNQLKNKPQDDKLEESYKTQLSENTKLVEKLKNDVTKTRNIAEGYKNLANKVISRYIELKAKNLGIKTSEITERLSNNYTLDDVDRVCESLQAYNISVSKLPIGINKNKVNISVRESKNNQRSYSVENPDDVVDEDLLRLTDSF